MHAAKVTADSLAQYKRDGRAIVMVTAYDASQAAWVDVGGVDVVLVGDSVGNVCHGLETTLPVTLDDMVAHSRWVSRRCHRPLVIADLPFLSYQTGERDAMLAAGRLLKEAGVDGVKLEGGSERSARIAGALVDIGIPVMGHVGLTPQSVKAFGGYRVQGRSASAAQQIVQEAERLVEAGVFALVLECVPRELAKVVTDRVAVPTIGIGAGPSCDGQVLVLHDLLGMNEARAPRFVKQYVNLAEAAQGALRAFCDDVREGSFPAIEHTYGASEPVVAELDQLYPRS